MINNISNNTNALIARFTILEVVIFVLLIIICEKYPMSSILYLFACNQCVFSNSRRINNRIFFEASKIHRMSHTIIDEISAAIQSKHYSTKQ